MTNIDNPNDNGSFGSSHFNVLMVCMIISVVLLIVSKAAIDGFAGAIPQWVAAAVSLAPMVYYHIGYLAPRTKNGLSSAAIDSVYYYGFLLTIVALGISALSMVSATSDAPLENPASVISQFGIGLLATGYAIVARLHLSSMSAQLGDSTPDTIIDQYISRSRQMVDHVELTLQRFDALSSKCNTAITAIETLTTQSLQAHGDGLQALTSTFDREMKDIFSQTKLSIQETRDMISDVTFMSERDAFVRSMKQLSESTAHLNSEFARLVNASGSASAAAMDTAAANDRWSKSLDVAGQNIENSTEATERFALELDRSQKVLASSTADIKAEIQASAAAVAEDVKRSSAAATLLTEKIIKIADIVIQQTAKSNLGTQP